MSFLPTLMNPKRIIGAMVQRVVNVLLYLVLTIFPKASCNSLNKKPNIICNNNSTSIAEETSNSSLYFLSWRLGVEANNVRGWRTVPIACLEYIERYMMEGQYQHDLELIVDHISTYIDRDIPVREDGMDAFILDVDDTCLSNISYYKAHRFGCDPFDRVAFKAWALSGRCTAIPAVLGLFLKLVASGFKVFLVTGRDTQTFQQVTLHNLHCQGFIGCERLIMRSMNDKGKSAIVYKSEIRKQLTEQGYRIWGNVGDQWSDLQGECLGNRTFKIPNPMYLVS
jgi:acid phosphatase